VIDHFILRVEKGAKNAKPVAEQVFSSAYKVLMKSFVA
jgi:hypothetical protein